MKRNPDGPVTRPLAPAGSGRKPDEAALSSVLGAILVFGLLVVTLVVIQTQFAPVWAEDREASHMQQVTVQLSQLKSDLDRQVDNRTGVAIANPLTLQRPGGFQFFGGVQVPGEVSFEASAAGEGLTIYSDNLTILQSGDESFLGLAEDGDWIPLDAFPGTTITDVTLVRALRMRINMDEAACVDYEENDFATLIVEDDDGEVGRATATWLTPSSGEFGIKLDIFANFDGETVADDQISSDTEFFFQQLCVGGQENFLDYHYFDLLDSALLFNAVLRSADTPFSLTLEELGLESGYVIVYDTEAAGGGTTTVGSLGITVSPYEPDPFPAGSLVFESNNQHYVEQTYVVEHGAVLRVQDGEAAMAVPPNFRVSHSASQTSIDWALPSLQGSSGALAGSDTATLVATPSADRIDFLATTAALTIDIPTGYPDPWLAFFDRELRGSGMDESTEYTLQPNVAGDGITLVLTGVSTLDAVEDIFLRFRQTNIDLDLRSSG